MFSRLPPAGERIVLSHLRENGESPASLFQPYEARYYSSGTAALAATVMAVVAESSLRAPEVLLPAYGCPDLVSAVLYAGARPRLIDLAPDRPWLNLDLLSAAIGPQTVAVVAVDLFGIVERYDELRARLAGTNIRLIQDSAQGLPNPGNSAWQGDYVVVSFGRGKPVSLLHGGAVLARSPERAATLPTPHAAIPSPFPGVRFRVRAALYNMLLARRVYWLPSQLPFLHLGETRFHPLPKLEAVYEEALAYLPANVHAYRMRPDRARHGIRSMLSREARDVVDLSEACGGDQAGERLLRYPVLAQDNEHRERLYRCLDRRGLGVSKMYPRALPDLPGLKTLFTGSDVPQARDFASRLLTLPVHSRVGHADIKEMGRCFLLFGGHRSAQRPG